MLTSETKKASSFQAKSLTKKSLSITNNAGTDLVVLRVSDGLPNAQLYEQSLQLLKPAEGRDMISAGSEATVDASAAGSDIIIAMADNLFPVKIISSGPNTETQEDGSVTVTASDVRNLQLAEKFKKLITAFPASTLAQDYAAALSPDDLTGAADFFKANTDYRSLDIHMVAAVDTYYKTFPFGWADYTDEKTFTLYTSNGTENKNIGTVTFANGCTSPVQPAKPLPDFSITYAAGDASQPLQYVNGQFTDDADSGTPAVCLQGLFMLKSELTQNEQDNTVIAVLRGTVNGTEVLGYAEEGNGKEEHRSPFDGIINPKNTVDWLELSGVIIGGIIVVGILCKLARMAYNSIQKWRDKPAEEAREQARQEWIKEQQKLLKTNQDWIDRMGLKKHPNLPDPEEYEKWSREVKNQKIELSYDADLAHITDIWTKQNSCLETALKYGRNDNLIDVQDSLQRLEQWLGEENGPKALADNLDKIMDDFKANSTVINKEWVKIKNKNSTDMIEVDRASRAIQESTSRVEENKRMRELLEEEEIPEIIED